MPPIAPVPLVALLLLCLSLPAKADDDGHWPSFHGPGARGVGGGSPPVAFDVASGDHIAWRLAIPGLAHASPVIWGDRIYLTTATSDQADPELKVGLYGAITPAKDQDLEHTWWVYALDRRDGSVVWKAAAHTGTPSIRRHLKASHANSTPATDGAHVLAFFGSEGLYCYDRDGTLRWKKDFGLLDAGAYTIPAAQWGFGSSPMIHEDKAVVLADVQKNGFLAVYDLATGREVWKVDRDEVPTWSTPTVIDASAGRQVVVNGFKHMGGYALADGEALWRISGGGDVPVPRPVAGDGLVYLTNAHGRHAPIIAVRPTARGEIAIEQEAPASDWIAWSALRGGAYMQTPILDGGILYVCRDNGVLQAFDARTGERHYQERLTTSGDGFTASGVAAGGRLYYASETGTVLTVKAGPTFELLAESQLGEVTMASPAVADGTIYFRTRHHLVAVGTGDGDGDRPAENPATRSP